MNRLKFKSYKLNKRESIEAKKRSHNNTQYNTKIRNCILKIEVLAHYGNGNLKCVKCGFDDLRALSLDHINSNGAEERKKRPRGSLYLYVKKNNYPKGYQTLCMNCQWIKREEKGEYRYRESKRWLRGLDFIRNIFRLGV